MLLGPGNAQPGFRERMEKGKLTFLNWTLKNEEPFARQRKEIRKWEGRSPEQNMEAGALSCGHVGLSAS